MAKQIIKEQTFVKQKMEFSKKAVLFVSVLFLACIVTSYVLSYLGKDPVSELSIALSASFTGVVNGYYIKSFLEKNSRNKNRVDEFGNFLEVRNESELETEAGK